MQVATLFIGATDAFEIVSNILLNRASQQAFGCLRFQTESLVLLRWLVEPSNASDRQARAYRVLFGQINRWMKLLKEDVGDDAEGEEIMSQVAQWKKHIRQLAGQDGITQLQEPPDRRHLFKKYGSGINYPVFSMYSELGAHPGAVGNVLFSLSPDSRRVDYGLNIAVIQRAFFSGVATLMFWSTCEAVSPTFGWDDWLTPVARPLYTEALPLMGEATKRRKELRASP
jgi:hypothetical protein